MVATSPGERNFAIRDVNEREGLVCAVSSSQHTLGQTLVTAVNKMLFLAGSNYTSRNPSFQRGPIPKWNAVRQGCPNLFCPIHGACHYVSTHAYET